MTAAQHRQRIGSGRVEPVGFSCELPKGSRVLAATDGVFNYARPQALVTAAMAVELDDAADQLVDVVRLPSGEFMDDMALVLVDP